MRGNKVQGRFKIEYENRSMEEGVTDELRDPVGSEVDWYSFDSEGLIDNVETWVDPVYDTSNQTPGQGVAWLNPIKLPVILAQQLRGTNVMNERGLYTVDTLRLVVAVADAQRLIPTLITDPTVHIKDRVLFQETVFVPTRVLPRGRYKNFYSVVTIDMNEVNAEELVNFRQFQQYAN